MLKPSPTKSDWSSSTSRLADSWSKTSTVPWWFWTPSHVHRRAPPVWRHLRDAHAPPAEPRLNTNAGAVDSWTCIIGCKPAPYPWDTLRRSARNRCSHRTGALFVHVPFSQPYDSGGACPVQHTRCGLNSLNNESPSVCLGLQPCSEIELQLDVPQRCIAKDKYCIPFCSHHHGHDMLLILCIAVAPQMDSVNLYIWLCVYIYI